MLDPLWRSEVEADERDLNVDGVFDGLDIDAMFAADGAVVPNVLKKFDVYDDGVINAAVNEADSDADRYIRDVLETQYGDATLDKMVGPSDLTELKLAWLQPGVGWANGNFDGVR